MKKNRIIILLTLLPLFLIACDNMRPDISITVQSDYSQIIDAVGSTSRSLSDKLQLIEAAVSSGFADGKDKQALLQQAVASLSGTLSEKLAAIESAVNSQTTSLETKLGLIEAAVTQGFANDKAKQELLQQAIKSLSGSLSSRLAAVEGAVNSQTVSLEAKLALIDTAVKEGLANEKIATGLVQQAVASLSGTLSEHMLAIETAMGNQTTSLAAKLDLIEAVLNNRMVDTKEAISLLQQAVENLSGTSEEKLAAIGTAIQSQTTSLEAKLALIEASVNTGFTDDAAQRELLSQAVQTLKGTAEDKLAAVTTAIGNQETALELKLGLIETAVQDGFADSNVKEALIQTALSSLSGNIDDKLAAIETAVTHQTDSIGTKLDLIQGALQNNLADVNDAIRLIGQALCTSLKDGVDEIVAALGNIDMTLYPGPESHNGLVWMIHEIGDAISANAAIDYTAVLSAIQHAIYYMGHNIGGYEYVELGHYKGTGPVLKWATMNVGASRPQDAGDYFAWGGTEPHYISLLPPPPTWKAGKEGGYADSTDKFAVKIFINNRSYKWGYRDDIYTTGEDLVLRFEHDAARQDWGYTWRIPTQDELIWLSDTDYFEWTPVTSYKGVSVNGMIVKSKENGNSIFLPVTGGFLGAAIGNGTSDWGYYWSSTVTAFENGKAQGLAFWDDVQSSSKATVKSHQRFWGFAIRPVSY